MFSTTLVKLVLQKSMKKGQNTPAPLKWGLENESVAIQEYVKQAYLLPTAIDSCGLVVNPKYPWLGCSHYTISLSPA